ncbi:mfs multidrug transporter [Cordyceps militaris]|uniref:Mfs multidrug transporter n=1 Tax=Cordyceps militaris TaxID=73501 RepID=A0A2H4SIY7_CORMI|nr:mfs multidrug transporter [Cordyceps militaris]
MYSIIKYLRGIDLTQFTSWFNVISPARLFSEQCPSFIDSTQAKEVGPKSSSVMSTSMMPTTLQQLDTIYVSSSATHITLSIYMLGLAFSPFLIAARSETWAHDCQPLPDWIWGASCSIKVRAGRDILLRPVYSYSRCLAHMPDPSRHVPSRRARALSCNCDLCPIYRPRAGVLWVASWRITCRGRGCSGSCLYLTRSSFWWASSLSRRRTRRCGGFLLGQVMLAYLLDEFKHAASANAAASMLSSIICFVFSIFAPSMYNALGYI